MQEKLANFLELMLQLFAMYLSIYSTNFGIILKKSGIVS
jgi:hypothetical protein